MNLKELELRTNYGIVRMILTISMIACMGGFLIALYVAMNETDGQGAIIYLVCVPVSYLTHKSALVLFDISDGILLLHSEWSDTAVSERRKRREEQSYVVETTRKRPKGMQRAKEVWEKETRRAQKGSERAQEEESERWRRQTDDMDDVLDNM